MISSNKEITVCITQRVDYVKQRDEVRDSVDRRLLQWVISAGFMPTTISNVLVSNDLAEEPDFSLLKAWLGELSPGALILSGGNNIGEHTSRDLTEKYLLAWAEENHVPVLGICRGMQMMAVNAGAKLTKVEGHVKTRHNLSVVDDEQLWPESVNSFHDWHIEKCPKQYRVLAQSEDGSIEAISHTTLPWEGWMWHPEREPLFNKIDTDRMKRLFNEK